MDVSGSTPQGRYPHPAQRVLVHYSPIDDPYSPYALHLFGSSSGDRGTITTSYGNPMSTPAALYDCQTPQGDPN